MNMIIENIRILYEQRTDIVQKLAFIGSCKRARNRASKTQTHTQIHHKENETNLLVRCFLCYLIHTYIQYIHQQNDFPSDKTIIHLLTRNYIIDCRQYRIVIWSHQSVAAAAFQFSLFSIRFCTLARLWSNWLVRCVFRYSLIFRALPPSATLSL